MTDEDRVLGWFGASFTDLAATLRRLWLINDQLEGGLIAGQSSGDSVFVAFALKYELRDGLLVERLAHFAGEWLDESWTQQVPALESSQAALTDVIRHLAQEGRLVARLRYSDSTQVERTRRLVGIAAGLLQDLHDQSVQQLIDRQP